MKTDSKDFLLRLLRTPSPTGFEQKIQRVVRARMQDYADSIETDYHGNVICALNPKAKLKVMLAGHCDQIGMMVTHISDKGFLYFQALGGIDIGVLEGSIVLVHAEKKTVPGVIGRKPIHLQKPEERGKSASDTNNLWIDVGASSAKEAARLCPIGSPITFDLNVLQLPNNLICSPGLDDKAGLFVAMETMRICSKSKIDVALYSVSTVQEEVGLRGARTAAFRINPDVGIAIDVTFANDNPGAGHEKGCPVKLGGGPVISCGPNINHVVEKRLKDAAKKSKIKFQVEPSGKLLGNDANAMQVTQSGVAAASLEIPNRYMHSQVEICSLDDLENAANLLATFIKGISATTNFTPR